MKIDIAGRVNNIILACNKPLLPLFEAIINSLDSIEDLQDKKETYIKIIIERDKTQMNLELEGKSYEPIKNIIIEDNGVGFNNDNYKAFITSDTRFKTSKGGKGIGRFLWLKAFDKVHIESIYEENNFFKKIIFDFFLNEKGIENESIQDSKENKIITRVNLKGFKKQYEERCPKKSHTIAEKIIEHFLIYFLLNNCPKIILIDEEDEIDLNKLYFDNYKCYSASKSFSVKEKKFSIESLRLYSGEEQNHKLYFCANRREVDNENLSKNIPNLNFKLKDKDGKSFCYISYLTGSFLDDRVNTNRTGFDIPLTKDLDFPDELTFDEIKRNAIDEIKKDLEIFLEPIREEKSKRIKKYISEKSPQYKPILKYEEYLLDEISLDISDDELETELLNINHKLNLKAKEETKNCLKKIRDSKSIIEFKKEYLILIEKVTDISKSNLSKYIIDRKCILDLFENRLKMQNDNSYDLESSIHEIIFPLHKTSEEISYENQNLWIIDEKLSYHFLLASDKPLKTLESIGIESDKRPDLIVFNNTMVLADQKQSYSSIVIIEFKRPMREEYSDDENPINQIYKYIEDIKKGTKKDKDGRPLILSESTPFYCYIICDITDKIKEFARFAALEKTPDQKGFFGFNKSENCYIEILSYSKLLEDSQKRNRILFEKLNII